MAKLKNGGSKENGKLKVKWGDRERKKENWLQACSTLFSTFSLNLCYLLVFVILSVPALIREYYKKQNEYSYLKRCKHTHTRHREIELYIDT